MQRASLLSGSVSENLELLEAMEAAHLRAPNPSSDLTVELHSARSALLEINFNLSGYESKEGPGERDAPTVMSRLFVGQSGLRNTYGPTGLHERSLDAGEAQLGELESALASFVETVLPAVTSALEATGAPPIRE